MENLKQNPALTADAIIGLIHNSKERSILDVPRELLDTAMELQRYVDSDTIYTGFHIYINESLGKTEWRLRTTTTVEKDYYSKGDSSN